MNKYQKALNKVVKENIKLYPKFEDGSFYKRRKLFRVSAKLYFKGAFKLSDLES